MSELNLSDCPYAVGTAEHSKWITDVYIPAVNNQRMAEDGAKVGAESQGRKVIHGSIYNVDGTRKRDSFYDDPMAERVMAGMGTWTIPSFSFTRLDEGELDLGVTNNFARFEEEFVNIVWIGPRTISFDLELSPEARRVFFDDLPEVSGASYTSGGLSRAKRR